MRYIRVLRFARVGLLGGLVAFSLGCGQLSIRTWIKVIEADSSGSIALPGGTLNVERLQGGFLALFQVNTLDLPAPLEGTADVLDVRVVGRDPAFAGTFCTWADPGGASTGTVVLDLLGGNSSAEVFLDSKAQSEFSALFNFPPVDIEQTSVIDIGSQLTLTSLLGAIDSGSLAGGFATTIPIVANTTIGGFPATVTLTLAVTNGETPPVIDADLDSFCAPYIAMQNTDLFFGLNSRSSYLLADQGDDPQPPLVVDLASAGVSPGDTISLATVGTYSSDTILRDGNRTAATAVFSASNVVLSSNASVRVPDAIDAGSDVFTAGYLQCFLLLCHIEDTDIPEDFSIDPGTQVVVPAGAQYLIVAPYDNADQTWGDNTGFGFGFELAVLP